MSYYILYYYCCYVCKLFGFADVQVSVRIFFKGKPRNSFLKIFKYQDDIYALLSKKVFNW